jgi:hypothetical protein
VFITNDGPIPPAKGYVRASHAPGSSGTVNPKRGRDLGECSTRYDRVTKSANAAEQAGKLAQITEVKLAVTFEQERDPAHRRALVATGRRHGSAGAG